MKIIVPIKQVPETSAVRMDEATGTIVREGAKAIVNPLDLYAIETALLIKEAQGAEVTALTMGPPSAVNALKEAVAMGCDTALLLTDKRFAGADTWSTSYVISRAIRKLGVPDLIICGERATDGDTGQVGPGVAGWLGLPVLSYVAGVEMPQGGRIRVRRMVEDGYEILETQLPALLTVVKEVANPRLPTLRGKQRAKKLEIPVWKPEDVDAEIVNLGLKGSPTRVVKIHRPKVGRSCERFTASDAAGLESASRRLAEVIAKTGVL
jgi:electron transfer flavoprotein beta subunit